MDQSFAFVLNVFNHFEKITITFEDFDEVIHNIILVLLSLNVIYQQY